MSERYDELIAQALAAAEIVSATAHSWFGSRSPGLAPEAERAMGAGNAREYLLYNLQAQLYADFYCAGAPRRPLVAAGIQPLPGHSPFVQALSQANSGAGALEGGWTVEREDGDAVVVTRDGLSLWMDPAEVRTANGDGLVPGAAVSVLMPKELLRLSPGFYMALGNAQPSFDGSVPIVRLYWNLRGDGAQTLVQALTARLNGAGVGFRLKVASDPAGYARCDAGVLYVRRDDFERLRPAVVEVHGELAAALRPATPALTKPLLPGLGLAEDPGQPGTSFGMSRCRLLAEAIVEAAERGAGDPAVRLAVVRERFERDGIALDAPYLNPGSTDCYELADA